LHVETKAGGKTRVYCYRRNQTDRCAQRSGTLDAIEWGIVAFLQTFRLPDEEAARILAIADDAATGNDDAERRRRELSGRLDRIRDMYKWGDANRHARASRRAGGRGDVLARSPGSVGRSDARATERTCAARVSVRAGDGRAGDRDPADAGLRAVFQRRKQQRRPR
jgi:hypothetical protein